MPPAMARPKGGVNIERATHIDKDGWYINGANVAAVFHSGTGEIRMSGKDIDRLAAYEDTGLEPEDIKRAFNEAAVLKLAGQALGITPDRLRELAQADREGRCVVPPCKVGQKVKVDVRTWGNVWNYKTVENGKFLIGEIVAITKTKKQTLVKIRVEHNVSWKRPTRRYPASAICKTVFLTREEAALRREQDG